MASIMLSYTILKAQIAAEIWDPETPNDERPMTGNRAVQVREMPSRCLWCYGFLKVVNIITISAAWNDLKCQRRK